jgi:hypothetical protein
MKLGVVLITDGRRDDLFAQTMRTIVPDAVVCDLENKGVGWCKNEGVSRFYDDVTHYLFIDDDMYLLPNWYATLESAADQFPSYAQIGGWQHPFNLPRASIKAMGFEMHIPDAVPGNCLMMPRWAWEKYGPFAATCAGPGQSEDTALSRKCVAGGEQIGNIYPYIAIHCGITNCLGEPAVGADLMRHMAEAQVALHGLKEKVVIR